MKRTIATMECPAIEIDDPSKRCSTHGGQRNVTVQLARGGKANKL